MCASCRKGQISRPFDGADRAIARAARKMAPLEFAQFTADNHERLDAISDILKMIVSSSIGREVTGEKSLAIKTQG